MNADGIACPEPGREQQSIRAPLFGFHDSSWQHFPYGSAKYRTHGSHGCVHMPLHAIAFLYRWGDTGTPVRIKR